MIRDMVAYQRAAERTAVYPGGGDIGNYTGLAYVALGLTGEAGEIANKVKKIARDFGGTITANARAQLADELGDVLWYVAQLATQLGVDLDAIAAGNLAKLVDRHARGVLHGSGDNR
jgi:NTP pyrophosphatase (non-canonical NTP hydrolase)